MNKKTVPKVKAFYNGNFEVDWNMDNSNDCILRSDTKLTIYCGRFIRKYGYIGYTGCLIEYNYGIFISESGTSLRGLIDFY